LRKTAGRAIGDDLEFGRPADALAKAGLDHRLGIAIARPKEAEAAAGRGVGGREILHAHREPSVKVAKLPVMASLGSLTMSGMTAPIIGAIRR
jgi:hypothetical protein